MTKKKYQYPEYKRNYHLQKTYGITSEEYDEMLEAQGGVCKICGATPGARRLAVDHCHDTGEIRGLLCYNCNSALGRFQDNIALLEAAIKYLKG